jgi:hypothetical protein
VILAYFRVLTCNLPGGTEEILKVSLSLGSLHVENRTPDIADKIEDVSYSTAPSSSKLSHFVQCFPSSEANKPSAGHGNPCLL